MRRVCMLLLPPAALVGGYWLRLQQTHAAAGPVPAFFKNIWGVYLWAALGGLLLLLILLALGDRSKQGFRESCRTAAGLPFQWAGTVLCCIAGAVSAMACWPDWQSADFFVGAATVLGSFFLLPAVMVRFRRSDSDTGLFLLPPLLLAMYRLLRYYLSFAADPAIRIHEMRLIFFAATLLFLLALAALGFREHGRRRLLVFAGLTVGAAGAAMADTAAFGDALLVIGCTGLAFGFYLSVLFAKEGGDAQPFYELVQADPFAERPQPSSPAESEPFPVIPAEDRPRPSDSPVPQTPAVSPEQDDSFDIGRVDRLMRETE